MKNILFRADSSSTIGTGHIMRDLVLASQYKELNIIFATQNLEGNVNAKIVEANYKLKILESNSIEELDALIEKLEIDFLVIDHYKIDYAFEKQLKVQNPKLKILSFDDTYEEHYCDILLNHNISADEERYKDLVPNFCELRCGSDYILLREEFITEKRKKTILLAMGGADSANLNIRILKVLETFSNIKVHVITTTANKNLDALKTFSENRVWVQLHVNSNSMAKLMKQSDFAIITPSVTANEAYYMEIPFIAIKTAENQEDMYEYLVKHDYLTLKKFDETKLKELIESMFIKLDIELVNFIDLTLDEKKMLLEWRNNQSIRQWMFTKEPISLKNHLNYIKRLAEKKDRFYFMLKEQSKAIGVIDFTNISKDKANIGLYAKPLLKGKGKILMSTILDYGFNVLKVKTLISEVLDSNESAIRLYKKFNFQEIGREENIIIMELKNENR